MVVCDLFSGTLYLFPDSAVFWLGSNFTHFKLDLKAF